MRALQSKHLMEANISVYMQLKLSQACGPRGSQIKIVCGLNQEDLERKLSIFFLVRDHDILSLIACRKIK